MPNRFDKCDMSLEIRYHKHILIGMFASCSSVQVDEDMQSGVETAPAGDADPSSPDGVKIPVSDSAATAQNDDGAPTQSELNLGTKVDHVFILHAGLLSLSLKWFVLCAVLSDSVFYLPKPAHLSW